MLINFELPAGEMSAAFKAVAVAASRDVVRPALQQARITWAKSAEDDGAVSVACTDSYRAHRVTFSAGFLPAVDGSVMVDARAAAAAAAAVAKAAGKRGTVALSVDSDAGTVTFSGGGAVQVLPTWTAGEFPDVCRFFNDVPGGDPVSNVLPAGFNPGYMADLVKAAGLVADDGGPVMFEMMDTRKPCRVTSKGAGMVFAGILMPQRV